MPLAGEVLVSKEDKEAILNYWKKIKKILDKYPYFNGSTDYATVMYRLKGHASSFEEWANLLHVKEEKS